MNPILEIQNISKKFIITNQSQSYLSLRDSISGFFKPNQTKEDFWALKDISFNVFPGETIGIIGKNGSGKSTLLKILSKITPPTNGKIIGRGRIASLLEVGTGFHPELTGRENIFMNGSILGMRRLEILQNFDAIVDFSGVEKFIDTPLKHYSSGMQLRLAFAVAAHLNPEILIIDEVLAVGDAEFQKKCLSKMQDVASTGKTVIFVSHDLESILTLCTKGVLLNSGKLIEHGNINDIVKAYTNHYQDSFKIWSDDKRPGDNIVKLNSVRIVDRDKKKITQAFIDQNFGVYVEYEILKDNVKPSPNIHFRTSTNTHCFIAIADSPIVNKGIYGAFFWIPENLLNNQVYNIDVALTTLNPTNIHFELKEVISINVIENKLSRRTDFGGNYPGAIRPNIISEINILKE